MRAYDAPRDHNFDVGVGSRLETPSGAPIALDSRQGSSSAAIVGAMQPPPEMTAIMAAGPGVEKARVSRADRRRLR